MMRTFIEKPGTPESQEQQAGFMLIGLIVTIFLILLVLGVAAPRVAKALRREREVEAVHRGNQYVRAVQLYYRKLGHYPGSMEQLEKTSNVRFLRQRYVDPMTGKPDWKLIHVGEAKTTVKGFFGKPLSGLPGAGGLGSLAGSVSGGNGASVGGGAAGANGAAGSAGSSFGGSSFGGSSNSGSGGLSGGSSFGSSGAAGSTSPGGGGSGSSFGGSSFGSSGASSGSSFGSGGAAGSAGSGASGAGGVGSQSATGFSGTGAPIMGIGSAATGDSILVLNEQTAYPKWEFIYDPRVEQMKAKAGALGGPASAGSGFGSNATSFGGSGSGTGSSGSSSGSTFGGSSFGGSPSGGTSNGGTTNGGTTTPPPQ